MHALARIVVALVLASGLPAAAQAIVEAPPKPPANAARLQQDDGNILLASYYVYPHGGLAFAIWRQASDGSPDRTFNGNGFTAVPIWGYYEAAAQLAIQADGKILVLGTAADRADSQSRDPRCHPSFCGIYVALVRLTRDGALDYSFNHGGKVVLDYRVDEVIPRMEVHSDGTVDFYEGTKAIGRLGSDGSIDTSSLEQYGAALKLFPFVQAQGLWKAPSQAQLAVSHQGDVVFVARFAGNVEQPQWTVMSAMRTGRTTYQGTFYSTELVVHPGTPNATDLRLTEVSEGTLRFDDDDTAVLLLSTQAEPETFSRAQSAPGGCAFGGASKIAARTPANLTDFWFDPRFPGRGLHLVQTSAYNIRATWFAYDSRLLPVVYQGDVLSFGYGDLNGTLGGPSRKGLSVYLEDEGGELYFSYQALDGSFAGEANLQRMVYREPGTTCR